MGKSTERLDNRSEEPKSDDETIKQALLYFKIANATGIPIEDRCKYLLKRGMREDDIDTMLAIIEQERLEKKRCRTAGSRVHSSFKIHVGRPKKLMPHVPGQKERRRKERQIPGPNKYGKCNNKTIKNF